MLRTLLLALTLAALAAPPASAAGASAMTTTPREFAFWTPSEFSRSCGRCSDRQTLFYWYDHKFGSTSGGESFATLDEYDMRPAASSFGSYLSESGFGSFGEEDVENPSASPVASELHTHKDSVEPGDSVYDDEGPWIKIGDFDCQAFNACHEDIQNDRCFDFHWLCGGGSSESEWLAAVAEAQSGNLTALVKLSSMHPKRVRVDHVRGIATLLSCAGSGAVALQESFTAVSDL